MDEANYSYTDYVDNSSDTENSTEYAYYDYYAESPYFIGMWSGEHIVAGLSIALFAIPGMIAYLTVIFVILRNPKDFANKSYYTFLLSLGFCDILQSAGCLFYAMPSIIFRDRVYGETFDLIYGSVGCGMLYLVGVANMILIAINRYCAVCQFAFYNRIFKASRVRIYLLISWLFGILSCVVQLFPGFGYHIYPYWYTWDFDPFAWGSIYCIWYNRVIHVILFLIMIFCYVAILIKRPGKMSTADANSIDEAARRKRLRAERVLALQFCLISAIFMIYIIANQLPVYNRLYCLFLTLYYIVFINSNPFIYFAFNSEIRQHILNLRGKVTTRVTVVTVTARSEVK